jgi:plasmid stabilization system protein ParE
MFAGNHATWTLPFGGCACIKDSSRRTIQSPNTLRTPAGVRKAAAAQHLQAGRLGAALAELVAAGDAEAAAAAVAPLVADVAAALAEAPQPGAPQHSSGLSTAMTLCFTGAVAAQQPWQAQKRHMLALAVLHSSCVTQENRNWM